MGSCEGKSTVMREKKESKNRNAPKPPLCIRILELRV